MSLGRINISCFLFSVVTIAVLTRNQTAQTVAKALVQEWFFRYGVPCRIHSDQGRCFDAKVVNELNKIYTIQKFVVAPMTDHKSRVINHTDLRVCVPGTVRRAVAEREPRYQTPRSGPNILHSDVESSDAESGRVESTISREPTINYSDSDSDQYQIVISPMPLRRST